MYSKTHKSSYNTRNNDNSDNEETLMEAAYMSGLTANGEEQYEEEQE
jgi:hypothetical protein